MSLNGEMNKILNELEWLDKQIQVFTERKESLEFRFSQIVRILYEVEDIDLIEETNSCK